MKESSSEKALDYMQKHHERASNYFQSKYNQREARQGYIDLYKLDQKKGEDIWNHTFPKFLRKNKLKKEDFIKTRFQKPKTSDINATIKPEPQNFILEKYPVDIVNEEIVKQNSKPIQAQFQIKNEHISPESIEAVFEGLWTGLRLWWPLDDLTKEEKKALGGMWIPAFRKYLTEKWAIIGIPLSATLGIIMPKIAHARKEARDKKKKNSEVQDTKDYVS